MIADRLATLLFDGSHPRDPALANFLGLAPQAASGARVNTHSVLGLSAVFRGVNIIGNGVAKCKPLIYERISADAADAEGRDKRRAMEHPSWRWVTRRANQWMSAGEFRKTLTAYAMLRGNGIGYCTRNADGSVFDAIPLLPDRTGMAVFNEPLSADSDYPEGEIRYWTMVGGEMRTLLPENIVHIRGLSQNGVWGLDVVEVMRETFGLAIAARDCGARFYGQGMLGSGVLYMPPGMNKGPKAEETIGNFIKAIKEQVQGLSKAHRLLVIDDGAKFEKLSVDPEDAQALETREFEVREIANIIGCQAHKLGDTKRTSYSSLEQSNQEHLDDDIDPWLTRWEESLEEVALTEDQKESGSHYVECNRKALMRTNLAARGAYYSQARNGGWMSANDIRRAEGDDPIGPQGDVYLVPANMMPADQAGAAFVTQAQESRDEGREPEEDDAEETTPPAEDEKEKEAQLTGAAYKSLVTHECWRLINRTLAEAQRKAAKGGGEYLAFLDSIDAWCQEPDVLRPLLTQIGTQLKHELDAFTHPPHLAVDLKQNIAAAEQPIKLRAICLVSEHLQPKQRSQAA